MFTGILIHRRFARPPCTIRSDTTITLRDALDAANNAGGSNTITFAQANFGHTITLTSNDTQNPFFRPSCSVRETFPRAAASSR